MNKKWLVGIIGGAVVAAILVAAAIRSADNYDE